MKKLSSNFCISLGAALVFAATLAWYTAGIAYPGPVLIGVVAGVVTAAELFVFSTSIKNFKVYDTRWKTVMVIVISFIFLLAAGYFFVVWAFLKFAGVW